MRRGDVVTFPLLPTAVSVCAVCEKPRWRARGDLIVFPRILSLSLSLSLSPSFTHSKSTSCCRCRRAASAPATDKEQLTKARKGPRMFANAKEEICPPHPSRRGRQKRLRGQTIESRLQQVIVIAANKQTPRTSTSSSTSRRAQVRKPPCFACCSSRVPDLLQT